jgi:hypothetical protein
LSAEASQGEMSLGVTRVQPDRVLEGRLSFQNRPRPLRLVENALHPFEQDLAVGGP